MTTRASVKCENSIFGGILKTFFALLRSIFDILGPQDTKYGL